MRKMEKCKVCNRTLWDSVNKHRPDHPEDGGPWCFRNSKHGESFEERAQCFEIGFHLMKDRFELLAAREIK